MNKDLKTRILAYKKQKIFYTAVQLFGRHKKRGGKPSVMESRKKFMKEL